MSLNRPGDRLPTLHCAMSGRDFSGINREKGCRSKTFFVLLHVILQKRDGRTAPTDRGSCADTCGSRCRDAAFQEAAPALGPGLYRRRVPRLSPHALHCLCCRHVEYPSVGRHRRDVPPVLAGTRLLVQEDPEDGCLARHLHREHHLLDVGAGHPCGPCLRVVADGLHLPGGYACDVVDYHYL